MGRDLARRSGSKSRLTVTAVVVPKGQKGVICAIASSCPAQKASRAGKLNNERL
jgi:hypothetical protein